MIKFYGYNNCDTSRKAEKTLKANNINYKFFDITLEPPSSVLLKKAIKSVGGIKPLFNTSGMVYRELNIKEKLPTMTDKQAIDLLASHGKLIKRPFVANKDRVSVGFKEQDFIRIWK